MDKIIQAIFSLLLLSFMSTDMSQTQKFKPVEGTDLKARWEHALKDAPASHPQSLFLVGYSFDVRHGVNVEITPEPGIETQNLGLFFLYDPKANSIKKFEVLNLDRQRDYQYPVYWLGQADTNESLGFIKGVVAAKIGSSLSPRLVEVISMHEGPQADALLEEIAQHSAEKSEKEMAVYWLRERATARQPFKDMAGDVSALSEIVRNDQESLAVRRRAALALGMGADPAGLRALATLYREAKDSAVKKLILGGAQNKVNDTSVALFLEVAATESDPQLRQQAADWLAEKTGNRIAWNMEPGLRLFANDEISEAEDANLKEISRRPQEEALSLLIKTAETHPKIGVRKAAVARLGRIGGKRALEFFRKVLSEELKAAPVSAGLN